MKLFKYKDFILESQEEEAKQTKEEIESICKKHGVRNYTINDNETVDVDGSVSFYGRGLTKIPLKFGKVTGNFNCSDNLITSLEGFPEIIGGYFDCSKNKLTNLKGFKGTIGKSFYCDSNQLTSLEGAPKEVGASFFCGDNKLLSLEGCPTKVGGDFNCSHNQLTSLEGCPTKVVGNFNCSFNRLTSLEGCPSEVGGDFNCSHNQLRDVKGFPRIIQVDISMFDNPVEEIFKLFPDDRWKEVPEFINEYDVIRDGNKVVLQALEVVYDELGLEVPEEIYIEGYEII